MTALLGVLVHLAIVYGVQVCEAQDEIRAARIQSRGLVRHAQQTGVDLWERRANVSGGLELSELSLKEARRLARLRHVVPGACSDPRVVKLRACYLDPDGKGCDRLEEDLTATRGLGDEIEKAVRKMADLD